MPEQQEPEGQDFEAGKNEFARLGREPKLRARIRGIINRAKPTAGQPQEKDKTGDQTPGVEVVHPEISVQREVTGFIWITPSYGHEGSSIEIHPVYDSDDAEERGEPSVVINVFADEDHTAHDDAIARLEVKPGEDEATVSASKLQEGVDVGQVMERVRAGLEKFDQWRSLPSDNRGRVTTSGVFDDMRTDLAGDLRNSGFNAGPAEKLASWVPPESTFEKLKAIVDSKYELEA